MPPDAIARRVARSKQLRDDYAFTFGSPAGLRVLADLERRFFVKGTTFVAGDAAATAYNEGMRYATLHIRALIDLDDAEIERRAQATAEATDEDDDA